MPTSPDALDIVTLAEAKTFLNIEADETDEDDELQSFITAMTNVIEAEVGPVVQREETAIMDGSWSNGVKAPRWPIVSVTSGAYLSDDQVVDVTAMVPSKGLIVARNGASMPSVSWQMTYQAGRPSIPSHIKKGALEVLKLAWATQRGQEAPAFLISYRAAAWFKGESFSLGFA